VRAKDGVRVANKLNPAFAQGGTGAFPRPAYISHRRNPGQTTMDQNAIVPVDELWQRVRREAETALASDPLFGRSLSSAIIDHSGLGNAVAHQIGERLGRNTDDRERFARIAREAYQTSPGLVDAAGADLQSIVMHDPAATRLLPPLLNFKGYVALQAWRVSNWLWHRERTDLALLLQSLSSDSLQVSIHPSASIGTRVYLDHATGIIVGAFVVIGDEVTIMQGVTIGRKQALPNRAPRIGRGVLLSGGATILGDISVGDFAKIGAGALVEHDVPGGCTAVGVPAKLVNCAEAGTLA
jgi:serine O-acetyltransferase